MKRKILHALLMRSASVLSGAITHSGNTFILTPSSSLQANPTYTVTTYNRRVRRMRYDEVAAMGI